MRLVERTVVGLGDVGVELDLVDRGHHLGLRHQPPEVVGLEVRHPDGAGKAGRLQALEGPPGREVEVTLRQWPVDEQQVDLLEAKALQGVRQPIHGPVIALEVTVELGGDEELVAGQAATGERTADTQLVAVAHGGVDVAVAGLDGVGGHRLHLGVVQRPGAEADLGDGVAVVHGDAGDVHGGGPSYRGRWVHGWGGLALMLR